MQFRRIYWVTEQLDGDGKSQIGGVFTSIQDLLDEGLRWSESGKGHGFRVTLVKLDSDREPLGSWTSPDFSGMEADLEPYITTQEFDRMDCEAMVRELRAFVVK